MNYKPHSKIDLKSLSPDQIDLLCTQELGQKHGQGLRIAKWLYRRGVENFDDMEDVNKPFREQLKRRCSISTLMIEKMRLSEDSTVKLLYRLSDNNTIEGVLIPGRNRLTLCVSSQVGCAAGCAFCMTGAGGFVRNLTVPEIVNQVFAATKSTVVPITNIVLMGTGEPLNNYNSVKSFVEITTDRNGMGFSPRKVTISTCGLAPAIEQLANDRLDVSLAVSLNATTDALRDRIMPVNKTYPIARLIEAMRYYCDKTDRSVTIEYVLLKDLNDTVADVKRLMDLLKGLPCMINILLFNPFPGCRYERPDTQRALSMRDMLVENGYVTVVRNSRGHDIHAACGQLKASTGTSRKAF